MIDGDAPTTEAILMVRVETVTMCVENITTGIETMSETIAPTVIIFVDGILVLRLVVVNKLVLSFHASLALAIDNSALDCADWVMTNLTLPADKAPATLKLLLMGDSGVGKSSVLLRFVEDKFLGEEVHAATIGSVYCCLPVPNKVQA